MYVSFVIDAKLEGIVPVKLLVSKVRTWWGTMYNTAVLFLLAVDIIPASAGHYPSAFGTPRRQWALEVIAVRRGVAVRKQI
jgi:hypothetical protein